MGIFDVLTLVCGLALFLYGMDVMGNGLKKSAGRKLKTILGNLTSSKLKGFLLGLAVTAIIQSSSATTVMVVGFVSAGTMTLAQAISVILGANLGTAVTAWLTALNSLGGDAANVTGWLEFLTPDFWMPILAIIGIVFIMFSKKEKQKDLATVLLGFAVLMVGMSLMSGAVGGLKSDPEFAKILTIFNNPILGVLVGTALTAIVQSSSASVGILQALSMTGGISFGMAIPIVLGQNIGTCVTAMLSALGANKAGKRTAVAHLFFNVIGVTFWLSMYYLVGWILELTGVFNLFELANTNFVNPFDIAIIHTCFKILAIAIMWPFTKLLEKLACKIVKGEDKKGDEYTAMLDDILLDTPSVAIQNAYAVVNHMSDVAINSFDKSLTLISKYDSKLADEIRDEEGMVDIYEDALGAYLVKLSSKSLDEQDATEVTKLLHLIGDLERISDHAVNIVESAEEIADKKIVFSEGATKELDVIVNALDDVIKKTNKALTENDLETAMLVEPLEQVIDDLKNEIRRRHVQRLQKNECTIELGFVLNDLLTNLERVSDHCSNIASCILDISEFHTLEMHSYLKDVKNKDEHFTENYNRYTVQYMLPAKK